MLLITHSAPQKILWCQIWDVTILRKSWLGTDRWKTRWQMTRGLPLTLERACHDRVGQAHYLLVRHELNLNTINWAMNRTSHCIVEACAISGKNIKKSSQSKQWYEEIKPPLLSQIMMSCIEMVMVTLVHCSVVIWQRKQGNDDDSSNKEQEVRFFQRHSRLFLGFVSLMNEWPEAIRVCTIAILQGRTSWLSKLCMPMQHYIDFQIIW